MARVDYRLWSREDLPLAGKLIIRPETPEEDERMRKFKAHVGSRQKGRKLEVIYKKKPAQRKQRGAANDQRPESDLPSGTEVSE